ncbi:hypothetical protein [Moorena sp. SIO3B2]|nr:hypothetical protein [Moorena sp. SIO3B2]
MANLITGQAHSLGVGNMGDYQLVLWFIDMRSLFLWRCINAG